MSLNRPEAASIGAVSALLGMDRTTLTANLKPLERRGLVTVAVDATDRRGRRMALTAAGRALLGRRRSRFGSGPRRQTERLIAGADPDGLRADLRALS